MSKNALFDIELSKIKMIKQKIMLGSAFVFIISTIGCAKDSENVMQPPDMEIDKPFLDVTDTHLISNTTGQNSMDAAVVDIDADGDLDIILAIEFGKNVILINDGTGRLVDESDTRFPNANHDSEDIAVADFDGDNDIDIVFVSEDDQTNEFYVNNGSGQFTSDGSRIPVSGTSNAVETADLNDDGFNDLIIGNGGQNYILINDGTGSFINETSTRLPSNVYTTQDIDLGDIDNDGDLDIIEGNEMFNRILVNNGSGIFTDETLSRLPNVNDQTREVDLGDIDNDGDLDIIFANVDFGGFGDPQNRLLENDGTGIFTEITTSNLPESSFRTVDIDFTDINGDGFLDILSGNRWNGTSHLVLINDGTGSFSDQTNDFFPKMNIYTFDYQVADFNKDGLNDIYMCGFQGADLLLFGSSQ